MGIVNSFSKRKAQQQPKFKVGDAVEILADPKNGYPVPLPGTIYSVAGVDSKGDQWYKVKPDKQLLSYGPGNHSVREKEIRALPQQSQSVYQNNLKVGDEVQGADNPGGRGTVLEDSFVAPDGKEWVKVGWPDDTITYEYLKDLDSVDELTEGTEKPLSYYVSKFGQNPKVNQESIGGGYPDWLDNGNRPGATVQQPSGPTKDQLSDRIYDITLSKQPEAHDGELAELLEQWKQLTGTPQPRFLGGSR